LKANSNSIHQFIIVAVIATIFLSGLNAHWKFIEDFPYYVNNPLFSEISLKDRLAWSWTERPEYNYIPVTWSLAIVLQEIAKGPFILHLLSLLLHLSVGLLAYRICIKLKLPALASCIAVLMFAVHPMRVESVVWASSLKGILATFFVLLAVLAWMKGRVKASMLLYVLSILSKQTLIAMPLIFFLYPKETRPKNKIIAVYLLISALGAALAMWSNQDNPSPFLSDSFDLHPLTAIAALGHYVQKTLLPLNLIIDYPLLITWVNVSMGGIILLLAVLALTRIRNGTAHLKERLILLFITLLLPVSGLIATPLEFAADRLSYLPALLLIVAIVHAAASYSKYALALCSVTILPLAFITHSQIKLWKDLRSQCETALLAYPTHYLSMISLAHLEAREQHYSEAIRLTKEVTHIHPHRYRGWQTLVKLHLRAGDPTAAKQAIDRANITAPSLRLELDLLSVEIAKSEGDLDQMLQILDSIEQSGQQPFTVHVLRTRAYCDFDQWSEAENSVKTALEQFPDSRALLDLQRKILEKRATPSSD